MESLSSLNPWSWKYTPEKGAIAITATAAAVVVSVGGVLAIFTSQGICLAHVTPLKVLGVRGGGVLAGIGAVVVALAGSWSIAKREERSTQTQVPADAGRSNESQQPSRPSIKFKHQSQKSFDFPETKEDSRNFETFSSIPFASPDTGLAVLNFSFGDSVADYGPDFIMNQRAHNKTNPSTIITIVYSDDHSAIYPGNTVKMPHGKRDYLMVQIPVVIGYCIQTKKGSEMQSDWSVHKDYFYTMIKEKKAPIALCITPSQEKSEAILGEISCSETDDAHLFPREGKDPDNKPYNGRLDITAPEADQKFKTLLFRTVKIGNFDNEETPVNEETSVVIAHVCSDMFMESFERAVEIVKDFQGLIAQEKIQIEVGQPIVMGSHLGDIKSGGAILLHELLESLKGQDSESFFGDDFYTHLTSLAQHIDNQSIREGATAFLKHMFPEGDPGASFFKQVFKK